MSDQKGDLYVKVKDLAGNEFVCPIDALKNPEELSDLIWTTVLTMPP